MEKDFTKRMEARQQRNALLNEEIKAMLLYVGFAGAIISGLAYIVITIVMVTGFSTSFSTTQQIIFSLLGVVVGLMITFLLRSQGIAFAKREPKSQQIMGDYHKALNKKKTEKQMHDINYYVFWATIKDIIIKGISFAATTYFALYIAIQGNGDFALIGLAIANVLFFLSLGLIALSKAYDFYLEEHLEVIKERTQRLLDNKVHNVPHRPIEESLQEFNEINEKYI